MRIISLDLERFGPFTGQTLTFKPDTKLHIVYGENEAGKSCALAAITDLFFGIERPTRSDFLHERKELRIGAIVETQNGSSKLAFKRRYGKKNTLLDSTEKVLSDDALLPYLGNLSREVFCSAFGLDAENLRLGAEEMLKIDGEVGESLFAAASGMRGLSNLRRSMDGQADVIFTPHASKNRSFYQALGRFDDARKAIKEKELRAGDWKALNEKIDEFAQWLDQIKTKRSAKVAERARLLRIKRIAPLVRLIDDDLRKLNELGSMPELPSGFADHLRRSLDTVRDARETSDRAAADEAKATKAHANITVDEALIARAGDVLHLFGETSAYAHDRGDLPRIQAESDGFDGELAQLAMRLGLNVAAVEAEQPTAAAQALIGSLIGEGLRIANDHRRQTTQLAEERGSLAELECQRAEHGELADPQPFREKFSALTPVLKTLEGRAKLEQTVHSEVRGVREICNRLVPCVTDLDKSAATALPSLETITRFRRDFDAIAQEVRREQDRITSATEALAASEIKLADLASGRPVPSRESITEKRQQRDAEWSRLRGTLFGSPSAITGVALAEGVANFERQSSAADELADTAISDAKRVASHAAESKRVLEERTNEEKAQKRLAAFEARQQEISVAWNEAWSSAEIMPLPPAEMTAWLTTLGPLLDRRDKLKSLGEELASIDQAATGIKPAIDTLAAEIGLPELKGLDLTLRAHRIEDRLRVLGEAWHKMRELDTRVRDVQVRIGKLKSSEEDAKRLLDDWTFRWKDALPAIGLKPTATLDEAEAALDAWSLVPNTIRERDNRARRVAGMKRNTKDFEVRAQMLLDQSAPDLAKLPAEAAVKEVNDRLTRARAAETRKIECERSLTDAIDTRVTADEALTDAEVELAVLAAKLPADTDLTDLLDRHTQRAELLRSLNERRTQLVIQAEGHTEDELRSDLLGFSADGAEAMLKELGEEEETLEREAQQVFAARDRSLREREALEQGVGAEIAGQQRRSAEAELITAAREWLVLKLAALLIGTAIDRRRLSQQDPLLARAGALFATLTGGSFAGVGQDFDDQDVPRLVGRRPSKAVVPVAGMSTGARDQLYLALRLAYLESYADRAEPVPFIGDDLFASFDDDRTAQGLAALAAIGNRVQPILFTHHRHVVEIAHAKMDADVSVLTVG